MGNLDQYNVIVIGAGVAGLAAAHELYEQGVKDVLIIEARDRIGGRVWTTNQWGMATDLGASWIHTINNNPITELAKKYKVDTIATTYSSEQQDHKFTSFDIYDSNGKKIAPTQMQIGIELIRKFNLAIEQHTLKLNYKSSYADALRLFAQQENLQGENLHLFNFMAASMLEDEFAADLDQISITTTEALHTNLSGEDVLPIGGYIRLLSELAKNTDIILNDPVTSIKYDTDTVTVTTEKCVYSAKYAIVTLPLGVLQSGTVKFSPELPNAKLAAIKNLRMGVYNKIYLLFDEVFWNPEIEWIAALPDLTQAKTSYEALNLYKYFKQPVLLFFTAGSFAEEIEAWSDQKIVDQTMNILKSIYGSNIPAPSAYIITRWSQDPFTRGSYSYPSLNSTFEDYKALGANVADRLFFAGEATSMNNPSTVHGAYMSGVAAANKIQALLDL
jgi:monoamine oxidase